MREQERARESAMEQASNEAHEHEHDHHHHHDHGQASEAREGEIARPAAEYGKGKGGVMSQEQAAKILNDAFSSYKPIKSTGVILVDTAGIKAAWQAKYKGTKFDWKVWVEPKGGLNGFADRDKSLNYVNTDTANAGTTAHEMLHTNTARDYAGVVGPRFNEGSTDYLKQFALKKAKVKSPNSYSKELKVVNVAVKLVTQNNLFRAYLNGGAQKLIADVVDQKCEEGWAKVREAMEARDFAKAIARLKKKK